MHIFNPADPTQPIRCVRPFNPQFRERDAAYKEHRERQARYAMAMVRVQAKRRFPRGSVFSFLFGGK